MGGGYLESHWVDALGVVKTLTSKIMFVADGILCKCYC